MPTERPYPFIKEHDVKRYFCFLEAASLEEAMNRASEFLTAWIEDKIPYDDLPPYSHLFSHAFSNYFKGGKPTLIIDSVGRMHWIQADVMNKNLWIVFYALGSPLQTR